MTKKIIVMFSGTGTNLKAICEYAKINSSYEVIATITNKADAGGIKIAENFNIPSHIVEHKNFSSREDFDSELVKIIKEYKPDLVVLAGFMRILTPLFTQNVKAVNIHPSLLPLFAGANAIKESFESKMKLGGITIHFVDDGVDSGNIIAQVAVEKLPNDTLQSYEQRIHEAEWELYPKTIDKILIGDI